MTDSRSRRFSLATLTKTRRFRSTGVKSSAWDSSISALPSTRIPPSSRAKCSRARTRAWVSEFRYMSVFRQARRSMCEIGAACTRSWRPKMTARRRSLRNTKLPPSGSKYVATSDSGRPASALAEYVAWRATVSAPSSTSVP